VLAGAQEAFHIPGENCFKEEMSAIGTLLEGLFDYAGLYPPARLDMRTAVRNYLDYRNGEHAAALGRFVVDLDHVPDLREKASNLSREIRLSAIALPTTEWDGLSRFVDDGLQVEAIEIKAESAAEIEYAHRRFPPNVTIFFEIPINAHGPELIDAISRVGARAKLRMGGIVAEAFPTAPQIAKSLKALADRSIAFKATAGLHHPIRSTHPFNGTANSDAGKMHGFINLCCAAALLHFGGEVHDAEILLEEEDPAAWQVTREAISWRNFHWTADQLRSVREQSLFSVGSCSFEEPVHDLETMGWL
jgi:hypothetical protein